MKPLWNHLFPYRPGYHNGLFFKRRVPNTEANITFISSYQLTIAEHLLRLSRHPQLPIFSSHGSLLQDDEMSSGNIARRMARIFGLLVSLLTPTPLI